jgi:hypothetical protein
VMMIYGGDSPFTDRYPSSALGTTENLK